MAVSNKARSYFLDAGMIEMSPADGNESDKHI